MCKTCIEISGFDSLFVAMINAELSLISMCVEKNVETVLTCVHLNVGSIKKQKNTWYCVGYFNFPLQC